MRGPISKTLIACLLLLVLVNCGLKIKDMKLLDPQGRELRVNGGCAVVKVPPYFPVTDRFDPHWSFNDKDIQIYKELGMNGVRLGAM